MCSAGNTDLFIPDFRYRPYGLRLEAVCGVHIKAQAGKISVLLIELPDNPGMSVTNASESVATEVLHRLRLADPSGETPGKIEWYEWYKDGSGPLSRVEYDWDGGRGEYRNPRWTSVPAENSPFPETVVRAEGA